ncbi:hypothetical protein RRF57_013416 [Xylaria bambusicola]|uniref:AAA+ ATPase domain-containing protein n=1 Tax=Xylaria bambusicola TaxID=326684 RepID=A0AAN7ZEB2_9PEZI
MPRRLEIQRVSTSADHMENKGEGQIFLFHGGPGVGKTFTAGKFNPSNQCIAEYTGRALLSLTAGDIGTDETKVEENLAKWFRLSETLGAVMLIDEADSSFDVLNTIEKSLFRTTNRVGTFDDAFMSRIHIFIAYDNLGPREKAKIWKQFFNRLSEDRQDMTVTARAKRHVLKEENLTELDWNGREIRNAFQTAVALAVYRFQQKEDKEEDEGPVLDQRDFEVHHGTIDERARRERSRLGPPE